MSSNEKKQAKLNSIPEAELNSLLAHLIGNLSCRENYRGNSLILNSKLNNHWVTDHMTDSSELLTNAVKATKCPPVLVANGSKVAIEQIGNANILSNNISDVLHLPLFTSNLLSVSKITKELNCNVIFSPINVIFQDIKTQKIIGEGKLDNGLYYLNIPNKAFIANNVEENKLWHWRIEHASDNVLHKLMPLKNLNNSDCDTYRFFKQTRLPFLTSNSKTLKHF
jgi:hypothetical protein